jgi:hypothetical protein
MRRGNIGRSQSYSNRTPSPRTLAHACAAVTLIALTFTPAHAAEFGTGPWVKGYTDIFGGIVPSQPGFYFRTDAYHYEGSADRTVFDGFAQIGVEEDYTATARRSRTRSWCSRRRNSAAAS